MTANDVQSLQTRTLAQLTSLLRHRQERGLPLTATLTATLTDIAQMHPPLDGARRSAKAYAQAREEFVEAARAAGVMLH